MLHIRSIILMALFASACSEQAETSDALVWSASYSVSECRELSSLEAILERCGRGNIQQANDVYADDPSRCVPFSKPTLLTGVWVTGLEYSGFYEGARSYAEVIEARENSDSETWFSPIGTARQAIQSLPMITDSMVFEVEVMGQKSLCEGQYGHEGYAQHEVVARNFLSIRPIRVRKPVNP